MFRCTSVCHTDWQIQISIASLFICSLKRQKSKQAYVFIDNTLSGYREFCFRVDSGTAPDVLEFWLYRFGCAFSGKS
ncbi:hypothetical protein TSMEX_003540 [Taenia solium]|eukprot:TsM_000300500 transcript=TsM_000300500 gene=TsM_000300500